MIPSIALLVAAAALMAAAPSNPRLVKNVHPTLATIALGSAELTDLPTGVVLVSGEITITQKQLDTEIAKAPEAVRPQMKRNLFYVLENKAAQMFLGYEAAEWVKANTKPLPKTQSDPVKAYLSTLTIGLTVSDKECRDFFDKNPDVTGGASYDQVKDDLRAYLLDEKRESVVRDHIGRISDRFVVQVNKSWTAKQNSAAIASPVDKARLSGKPTMVDLGADGCVPCEMMTPILESLKKDYAGKANILFVHVRKEQILGARYGVSSIPVQVFFDKSGKEVFRHVGYYPKEQIVARLGEMGVR